MLTTTSFDARRRAAALLLAPYWQLARRSFQRYATYRAATAAGVFTNTVFGFIRGYVFLALYRHRAEVGGWDATDAITYSFVTQGLLATTGAFGSSDTADRIRTGDIVSDLYRPLRFQAYWAAQNAGRAAFQAVFRGIPPVVVGAAVFSLRSPTSALVVLEFGLSVVLAVQVAFAFSFTVSLTGFWLIDTRGVAQIGLMTMMFFAGAIVPLTYFPPALAHAALALPFPSIVQLPTELFLGRHPGAGALGVIAQQAGWVVVLTLLNEVISARALHKVVVQGG